MREFDARVRRAPRAGAVALPRRAQVRRRSRSSWSTRTACSRAARRAATASVGEDVTENLRTIRAVPLRAARAARPRRARLGARRGDDAARRVRARSTSGCIERGRGAVRERAERRRRRRAPARSRRSPPSRKLDFYAYDMVRRTACRPAATQGACSSARAPGASRDRAVERCAEHRRGVAFHAKLARAARRRSTIEIDGAVVKVDAPRLAAATSARVALARAGRSRSSSRRARRSRACSTSRSRWAAPGSSRRSRCSQPVDVSGVTVVARDAPQPGRGRPQGRAGRRHGAHPARRRRDSRGGRGGRREAAARTRSRSDAGAVPGVRPPVERGADEPALHERARRARPSSGPPRALRLARRDGHRRPRRQDRRQLLAKGMVRRTSRTSQLDADRLSPGSKASPRSRSTT